MNEPMSDAETALRLFPSSRVYDADARAADAAETLTTARAVAKVAEATAAHAGLESVNRDLLRREAERAERIAVAAEDAAQAAEIVPRDARRPAADADEQLSDEEVAEDVEAEPDQQAQPQFDPEIVERYTSITRELGVQPEVAQQLLDKIAPVLHERQVQRMRAMRAEWTEKARADVALRAGQGFDKNLGLARDALRRYGDDELRALLDRSGIGDHVAMIRFAYKIGRATRGFRMPSQQQQQPVAKSSTSEPTLNETSMVRRLYPSNSKP